MTARSPKHQISPKILSPISLAVILNFNQDPKPIFDANFIPQFTRFAFYNGTSGIIQKQEDSSLLFISNRCSDGHMRDNMGMLVLHYSRKLDSRRQLYIARMISSATNLKHSTRNIIQHMTLISATGKSHVFPTKQRVRKQLVFFVIKVLKDEVFLELKSSTTFSCSQQFGTLWSCCTSWVWRWYVVSCIMFVST